MGEPKSPKAIMDADELKLARQRLRIETMLRRRDQKLQQATLEATQRQNMGWRVLFTPWGAAVAAGVIGLCGTAATAYLNLQTEKKKQETTVILKASEVGENLDEDARKVRQARNLLWFAKAGYVTVSADYIAQLEKDGKLEPNQIPSAPDTTSGSVGWSFSVVVDGNDLVVNHVFAGWFGPQDLPEGLTASGFNLKSQPDFKGCSLPMSGFRISRLSGSPIPKLPWQTIVRVMSISSDRTSDLPLIEIGPSSGSGTAIDLTRAAFQELGGDAEGERLLVNFRIIGGAKFLPRKISAGNTP